MLVNMIPGQKELKDWQKVKLYRFYGPMANRTKVWFISRERKKGKGTMKTTLGNFTDLRLASVRFKPQNKLRSVLKGHISSLWSLLSQKVVKFCNFQILRMFQNTAFAAFAWIWFKDECDNWNNRIPFVVFNKKT